MSEAEFLRADRARIEASMQADLAAARAERDRLRADLDATAEQRDVLGAELKQALAEVAKAAEEREALRGKVKGLERLADAELRLADAELAATDQARAELKLRLENVLEHDVPRAVDERDAALAELADMLAAHEALEEASRNDLNAVAAVCRERTAERDRLRAVLAPTPENIRAVASAVAIERGDPHGVPLESDIDVAVAALDAIRARAGEPTG
jgi:seryl-tRNA synthetase